MKIIYLILKLQTAEQFLQKEFFVAHNQALLDNFSNLWKVLHLFNKSMETCVQFQEKKVILVLVRRKVYKK